MKKKNCSSSPGRVLVLECLAVSADRLMYPARGCSTHSGRWGVHPLRLTMDSSAPARALRGAPSSSPGRARLGAGHQKSGMTGGRHKYLLGSTAVWPLKVRRRNKAPSQDSCTRRFSALLHLVFGSSVTFGWRQVSSGHFKKRNYTAHKVSLAPARNSPNTFK